MRTHKRYHGGGQPQAGRGGYSEFWTMRLTPGQIALIRASYDELEPEIDELSERFYEALFAREPGLRALFRTNMSEQGMRFMSAIGVIIDHLDDPEALEQRLRLLAAGHAPFGIAPDAYRAMEEALIETFAEALGPDFTQPMELAWRSAFRQICYAMSAPANGQHEIRYN